jgi:hypothetical protein
VRIKRRGFSGTKGFVFPLIKPVCSSFMSSSVLHKIAVREEVVPVPFRHSGLLVRSIVVRGSLTISMECLGHEV